MEDLNLLIVHLSNGLCLALPVENLQGLRSATPKQLRNSELHGLGFGFSFPDLDADFYVPALIDGEYGNKRWISELPVRAAQAELGQGNGYLPRMVQRPGASKKKWVATGS